MLFFYAFITGFSPSVTRAVVMFSFIQSGKAFARHINMYNILCLSAFIILLWNPIFIFHVGFWLSHLAVAGIVAFYPIINSIFSFKFILWRWIWSIISVSVAAQITTVQFSLWMFGTFPTYFLLTNIILIPVIGPVLIISFILLMVSWIPVVPIVLGAFLNDMVGFMQGVVNYIESLPSSFITNIWVSWPLSVTLFLLIFFWYQNYQNPKPRLMLKTTFLLTMVLVVINIQWFIKGSSNKFIVFDAGQQFYVEVVNNGRCVVFSSTGIEEFQQIFISGGFEKRYINHIDDLHFINDVSGNQLPEVYRISCGNKTYCMLNGGKGSLVADLSHDVDILVISGMPNLDLTEFAKRIKCETIVFASNCPPWKVKKWRNQLENFNVFVHDVRSMGAYIDTY
jgi:competence protein ComEC